VPFPADRLAALTPRAFELSSLSRVKVEKWLAGHRPVCPYFREMRERIEQNGIMAWGLTPYSPVSYRFQETGIGNTVEAICGCGETRDVTDISGW